MQISSSLAWNKTEFLKYDKTSQPKVKQDKKEQAETRSKGLIYGLDQQSSIWSQIIEKQNRILLTLIQNSLPIGQWQDDPLRVTNLYDSRAVTWSQMTSQ